MTALDFREGSAMFGSLKEYYLPIGLAIFVVSGGAMPSVAQSNSVDGAISVKHWHNDQVWDTYRYFPNVVYQVDNSEWCAEDHRVNDQKYDHAHTSPGFNFVDVDLQITVTQAMADAGYDRFYGVGILNWVRVTNATMIYNDHGYAMGQTSPLIVSSTNGSLRYRDESGYSLVYPPASGGTYFDVFHSGKHPQIFHDGFFYRVGQHAEKYNSSGVYSRILSSGIVTVFSNWQ